MYVKIRNLYAKPGDKDHIVDLSKKNLISEVKTLIFEEIRIPVTKQRLYYRGKQLHDDCSVMDYNIQLNDVIQIMEVDPEQNNSKKMEENDDDEDSDKENVSAEQPSCSKIPAKSNSKVLSEVTPNLEKGNSKYYKIGDPVDFVMDELGAWFEGEIIDILKTEENDAVVNNLEPDLLFTVKHKSAEGTENECYKVHFDEIKPRSYYNLKVPDLHCDQIILANYNIEHPNTRGYWYPFKVKSVNRKVLQGTVLVGRHATPIDSCKVKYMDEVLRLEEPVLLENRKDDGTDVPPIRKTVYYCEKCKDVETIRCTECGCKICAGKDAVDTIILCDECNMGYHIRCLTPPLSAVPSDPEWFCPDCRVNTEEIVQAGEKIKDSKKKARMASAKASATKRDWGRGMACAGRTTQCTIVPINHFGAIPGVEVGTCWMYRMQVSEAGVHRSLVAGIHGRDSEGAFSLVLSGGYEDDIDYGTEFLYTGSGGRDLSNNKRVSVQSSDQKLTLNNKALARNCNTPLSESGGEAEDWKGGKPVRVVRTSKFAKHSAFAPKVGCRYDGVYKVVKYFKETGQSGFMVWRYLLRRDDPAPLPWDPEAPQYPVIFPDGYLENVERKKLAQEKKKEQKKLQQSQTKKKPKGKAKRRRKPSTSSTSEDDSYLGDGESQAEPSTLSDRARGDSENESSDESFKIEARPSTSKSMKRKQSNSTNCSPLLKKLKIQSFVLPEDLSILIGKDAINKKEWDDCKNTAKDGKPAFLQKITETFTCVCCQDLIYLPISMECTHNVCKSCLQRSFKADIYACPYCRFALTADFKMVVNDNLSNILLQLFPGYNVGR